MHRDSAGNAFPVVLPSRDGRQKFVQRTVLWLLLVCSAAPAVAAGLQWQEQLARPMDRVVPLVLALAFGLLAWRQWRRPRRMASTLWIAWGVLVAGLALPTWAYLAWTRAGGPPLVQVLPPIGPVLLGGMVVMSIFARSDHALRAGLAAWLLVAAPVLAHLLGHPEEMWTARGLELVLALGPFCLLLPLLIPMLRIAEQNHRALQEENQRLEALTEHDELTGLYNRRAAEDALQALLGQAGQSAALIVLDIDYFDDIRDNHGAGAADQVLVEVGRRCAAALRKDSLLARWSGPAFLVVLPGLSLPEAAGLAERLRHVVDAAQISPAGMVSASLGVTAVRSGDTLPVAVGRMTSALSQAQQAGRNRVVVI